MTFLSLAIHETKTAIVSSRFPLARSSTVGIQRMGLFDRALTRFAAICENVDPLAPTNAFPRESATASMVGYLQI